MDPVVVAAVAASVPVVALAAGWLARGQLEDARVGAIEAELDAERAARAELERQLADLRAAAGRAAAAVAGLAATEARIADGLGGARPGADAAERAVGLLRAAAGGGASGTDPAAPDAPDATPEPAGGPTVG